MTERKRERQKLRDRENLKNEKKIKRLRKREREKLPNFLTNSQISHLNFQDKGILRREQLESTEALIKQEASPAQPAFTPCPEGILTPPASNRKSL